MSEINFKTARVFAPLLEPARYKGAWGGRGSGKSHFFGELSIEDALRFPGDFGEGMRMVCIREVQKDLAQSSKALIEKKLREFKLSEADGFKVFKDCISTPGDGLYIFKGMNDYTADSIKSLEGFHRSWWEEAHTGTKTSINMLTPTIRAPGSELWFSWNPRFKTDPVDVFLRGPEIPTGAVVVKANWRDNPWLTPELIQERLDCERMQPDQYAHIWEGEYVSVVSGAYYAKAITKAREERRIGRVGPDELLTYKAFCDIGGTGQRADAFTIWVAQFVGRELRVLKYYEAVGQPASAHMQWLRENGYTGSNTTIWLPHDGDKQDAVFDVSYRKAFEAAGYAVEVVPNQGKGAAMARIKSAQRVWPSVYMDEEGCAGGLEALGWYHEKRDEVRNIGLGPDHDWSSHGADSYGLMCVVFESVGQSDPRVAPIKYRSRGYVA